MIIIVVTTIDRVNDCSYYKKYGGRTGLSEQTAAAVRRSGRVYDDVT